MLFLFLLVLAVVGSGCDALALNITTYSGIDCSGSIVQSVSGTNGTCVSIGSNRSMIVQCDLYYETNSTARLYSGTSCGGSATNLTLGADRCTDGGATIFSVTGCTPMYSCITTGDWTVWNTACGRQTRTRTLVSAFNDTAETACTPDGGSSSCLPSDYLTSSQTRTTTCVGLSSVGWSHVCDIPRKTCYIYPDSPPEFLSWSTFLVDSPVFTSGWTLKISGFASNCTSADPGCASGWYAQPPIVTSLSNITIVSGDHCSKVKIRILGEAATNKTALAPTCGAFVFYGNGVTMRGFEFDVDPACYDNVVHSDMPVLHGAAIRFMGQDATLSDLTFNNSVVGILISAPQSMQNRGDVGTVSITNLQIISTAPPNVHGTQIATCWGVSAYALSGRVSVQFASGSTSCVVSMYPADNFEITTNGVLLDLRGLSTPVSIEINSPAPTEELWVWSSAFYILISVIGVLSFFVIVVTCARRQYPDEYDALLEAAKARQKKQE